MRTILLTVITSWLIGGEVFAELPKADVAGMIVPLAGFVSQYGEAVQNGVRLYVDENAANCAGLTFEWQDSQYDGVKSMTAFRSLAARDAQIQYVWGSAPTEVLAPVAEKLQFPLLALGETETIAGKKFVLNFTDPAWEYSQNLLLEMRKRGLKKFAVVKAEYVYFNNLVEGLKKFLQPGETLEILASFQPSETDFRSTVTKLKKVNFDAVGVYLNPGQVSTFFKQLVEQGIQINSFGSTNFGSLTEIAEAKGAMEGALFADTAVAPDFRRRYFEKYKNDTHLATAAQAYDLGRVICGLRRGARQQEVLDQLLSIAPFNGAGGNVRLVNDLEKGRYFRFPVVVKTIRNGSPVVISYDGKQVDPSS